MWSLWLVLLDNGSFTLAKVSAIMLATATATHHSHYLPWWHDINRNDPNCVASPKVGKSSTMVTVACRCRWHYHWHYCANFCQWKHSLKSKFYQTLENAHLKNCRQWQFQIFAYFIFTISIIELWSFIQIICSKVQNLFTIQHNAAILKKIFEVIYHYRHLGNFLVADNTKAKSTKIRKTQGRMRQENWGGIT